MIAFNSYIKRFINYEKYKFKFSFSSHRRHFVNQKLNYILSVNFKVMSSTLRAATNLEPADVKNVMKFNFYSSYLKVSRYKFYFIVRDPYKRLESFYRDKFYAHPNENDETRSDWQFGQLLVLESLGHKADKNDPSLKVKLLAVTFSEVVSLLPKINLIEAHLTPQSNLLKYRFMKKDLKLKMERILKMEHKSDLNFLENELKINLGVRINQTRDLKVEINYTKEDIDIINSVYHEDFKLFSYEMKIL